MKNAILQICEKLRGYTDTEPYFEVVKVGKLENGNYEVTVQVVDPAAEQGAEHEILV